MLYKAQQRENPGIDFHVSFFPRLIYRVHTSCSRVPAKLGILCYICRINNLAKVKDSKRVKV